MYKNKRFRTGNAGIPGSQSKTISNLSHGPSALSTIIENVGMNNKQDESSSLRKTTSDLGDQDDLLSQESIMPSQAPSQRRYLSQSSMGKSQCSRIFKRIPSSYYENLLSKCGVILDNPDSITLEVDHITFVNKLQQMMRTNPEYPENVQRFLKGFEDSIKDESNLIKLLSGCLIITKDNENTLQSQETLVKNFLMIDFLQTDLINIFVDKMKIYAIKDFTESSFAVIPLILSQLKFINHFVNGEMLYTKIFELLAIATSENKIEIIKCFEDVIDSSRHDQAVKKLFDLVSNDTELFTIPNIATFGNMSLSSDLKSLLRRRMVQHINNTKNVTLILPFIKFVLNFDAVLDTEILREIIVDLRDCIDKNCQKISNSLKTEIFTCLRKTFMRKKKFYDIWMKYVLNMNAPEDHRPIDLLILVMIININDDKTNFISNLIKTKVKKDLFTIDLLESTTKLYPKIFAEYSSNLLEIIDSFLKDRDPRLVKFSFMTYKMSFGIEDYDEKLIISKLLRFVNIKSSNAAMMSKLGIQTDISTNALLLLTELNKSYKDKMIKNGTMLLRMLERVHDFNLTQYRLVMDLLCSVAYPEPPAIGADTLQEHLHMLVTKQVSSCIATTKKQGIIGAVRLIDHLSWVEDQEDIDNTQDSEQTFNSITDLPVGRGRKSAEIFEMILLSSANCSESLGLCYDELSFMLSMKNNKTHHIDKDFLVWLCDSITNDFYTNFFIEEISEEMQKDLANLYCINMPEEMENSDNYTNSIAVNIADRTLNPLTKNALLSVTILPALLNLVKTIQFRRHSGSLNAINAVPGTGILLPKLIDNRSELFDFIENGDDPDKAKKMIDIHYHLSNWYREIINAFACQDDKMIRHKIVARLNHLLKLEDRIRQFLAISKDYVPPNCHFIHKQIENPLKVSKLSRDTQTQANKTQSTSRKRKHTDTTLDTEAITNITTKGSGATINNMKANGKNAVDKYEYGPKEIYRYMDPDIMLLLKENVNLVITISEENLGNEIGLLELKFILYDLVSKLESFVGIRKDAEVHIAFNISSTDFISDFTQFLPKIMEIFKQLTDFIVKHESSGTLNCIEICYTKICLRYILRLLSTIFQWVEFRNNSNRNMLNDCLRITSGLSIFNATNMEFKELVLNVLQKVATFKSYIHELQSAVYLCELLNAISFYCFELKTESHKIMVEVNRDMLQRIWYSDDGSLDKGPCFNILLDKLVKAYVNNASLTMIQNILGWIVIEINVLKKKNDSLKTFPAFNRLNFPLLYRALCSSFIAAMNEEIHSNNFEPTAKLRTWEKGCKILNSLLEIVKNLNIQRNFVLFLKHAHIYIKLFLQYGMSMLERNLRRIPERTNELLKNFQQTTRYLHNLCCHSKAIQNVTIVTQIPLLRQTIELLVFKVKAALAANNCTTVFWMGNLKNKDLQGDEIISQAICGTENEDQSDEEQLPEDDEYNEGELFDEEDCNDDPNQQDLSRSKMF